MADVGRLPCAPAAERNFEPILGVLRREFRDATRVLEIGAGTGQHAAGFAANLPWLRWRPTDRQNQLAGLRQWYAAAAAENLEEPAELDVAVDTPPHRGYDAVFSANTTHIMGEPDVRRLFDLVGSALPAGGRFCLYGPFREGGRFSTESNERFDRTLRARDARMGIRDLEALDAYAGDAGLLRVRRYAMPGNNLVLVYQRSATGESRT